MATSPCEVNLMALPTRLLMICRNRKGSPTANRARLLALARSETIVSLGARLEQGYDFGQNRLQRKRLVFELQFASLNLGQVENVIDNL